ncbi:MAG: DUF835 domain-containing protein [Candidatus Thermoplasmatota archaeon]|nr:DUF835 domain-containing protein [Candidatus Thermoplasmatota archaeon]
MGLRAKLKKGEEPKTEEVKEEVVAPPAELAYTCPLCGSDVDGETIICQFCGAVFEENIYECGFCGAQITKDLRMCPACGIATRPEILELEPGWTYLIKEERPTMGFDMFVKSVRAGRPTCGISTIYHDKLRKKYNLSENVPVYWLSSATDADAISPGRAQFELTYTIIEFMGRTKNSIVFLHGLDQIVKGTNIDVTVDFLKNITDAASKKMATLIVSVNPNIFRPDQLAIIENLFDEILEGEYEERVTPVVEELSVTLPSAEGEPSAERMVEMPTPELVERKVLKTKRVLFPFTAIVGQETMKRALLLNAINPQIGGVLIQGERGTAKSIAVRGLAELLPEIEVVKGCRFSCDPNVPEALCWECKERIGKGEKLEVEKRKVKVVDLPLNATEDRVVGSLDVEKVLKEGLKAFEEGLMAEANRGILYIDEINLLDDYLVDILLDAAAMGVCSVEREGISVSYPAKFILVGSMNPEEGKLRPQLLDRLALSVEVKGVPDTEARVEIIRRQKEFTKSAEKFRSAFEKSQNELKERIRKAQELLPQVKTSEKLLEGISRLCVEFKVDGHRPDIMIQRAAETNAAFEGRTEVTKEDIIKATEMVFPHRMRKGPFEEGKFNVQLLRKIADKIVGK